MKTILKLLTFAYLFENNLIEFARDQFMTFFKCILSNLLTYFHDCNVLLYLSDIIE
jgi:hypothetical protein